MVKGWQTFTHSQSLDSQFLLMNDSTYIFLLQNLEQLVLKSCHNMHSFWCSWNETEAKNAPSPPDSESNAPLRKISVNHPSFYEHFPLLVPLGVFLVSVGRNKDCREELGGKTKGTQVSTKTMGLKKRDLIELIVLGPEDNIGVIITECHTGIEKYW